MKPNWTPELEAESERLSSERRDVVARIADLESRRREIDAAQNDVTAKAWGIALGMQARSRRGDCHIVIGQYWGGGRETQPRLRGKAIKKNGEVGERVRELSSWDNWELVETTHV